MHGGAESMEWQEGGAGSMGRGAWSGEQFWLNGMHGGAGNMGLVNGLVGR